MKVILMSAFSCLPNRGSEPGVGWHWALEASKANTVYVLTRTKCKKKIEQEDLSNYPNLNFLYCDSSSRLRRKSIYLEYIDWQIKAYKYIKKIYRNYNFDYAWHITFGNIFLPVFIYKLPIEFIYGPLGGGEKVDYCLYKEFSLKERIPHYLKDILIKMAKMNPFYIKPLKKAKYIIAKTNDTKKIIPRKYYFKTVVQLETYLDTKEIQYLTSAFYNNKQSDFDQVQIVYTGRLIPLKNLLDLLKALEMIKSDVFLHIVGDGNQRALLEDYTKKNKLKNITFYGSLSREETLRVVSNADIFCFPSLREGGTWSLMEAMLLEKPVICLKKSGMEMIVDEGCALSKNCTTHGEIIKFFADSIDSLAIDKDKRIEMGKKGRQKILKEFKQENCFSFIDSIVN